MTKKVKSHRRKAVASVARKAALEMARHHAPPRNGVEWRGAPRVGLCSHCDHRKTCTFPQARRGVQHCEEYR